GLEFLRKGVSYYDREYLVTEIGGSPLIVRGSISSFARKRGQIATCHGKLRFCFLDGPHAGDVIGKESNGVD
ncbi:unnamed protein product, partial [Sphenostylis stenocarpa]